MTDINKLIRIYYTADGENITATPKKDKRECVSNEYNQQIRQEANRKNRHLILDHLLNEIPFRLTNPQIQTIRYWIDTFNPYWKQFHRQASNETILLALIMIQRKDTNPRIQVDRFSISKKYGLTLPIFENIQNSLIFLLMKTTQLVYNQSKYYNHEILEKGNQR